MEMKDTLLMPKTDFPMRGNLPNKEPNIQDFWAKENVYHRLLEERKDAPHFILHDGPPYANGNLHMGHAMNKILKDFINRYKLMEGYRIQYVTGWDTHGLPIEQAVTKSGVKRQEKSLVEFRSICEAFAREQVEIQRTQFARLGIFTDWEQYYLTLFPKYEAEQIRIFAKMMEKGLIFRGFKTVYWSPSSESALAEAEIEYQDKKSPSIYVAFQVTDGKGSLDQDTSFVIWTTTPWTIPANLAIAVGEDYTYVVVEYEGKKYVVAEDLCGALMDKFGWENTKVIKKLKGNALEGVVTKHPLFNRNSPVVMGHHVTTESGTGVVHIAPGHGEEDFLIGKKYKLEILSPVDTKGVLTKEAGKYEGLYYEDANKEVGQDLEACGALLKLEFITHSYPHDWRTKKPIIYRATDQWFASIDSLKDELLTAIDDVKWYIPWGNVRLSNMVKNRDEWCISRQRVWGVPIPIFYAENGEAILDPSLTEHIASLFEIHGSNIWFEKSAEELLPEGYTHPESPNGRFTKETDIMDVWFDSGSSHAYIEKEYGFNYPYDVYLEGSDQYRGWFNSSLITGVATKEKAPYQSVVSHGFVLDGQGRKMSKSIGNIIDPLKLMKIYGADIVRLWVASVDYQADVRISDEILKQIAESYRKIRNTYRFLLGNLFDFSTSSLLPKEQLHEIDLFMLAQLQEYVQRTKNAYDNFEFMHVYKETLNFITNYLSAFYLDYAKDILYIESAKSLRRRQVQTTLFYILDACLRVLVPIIPHTAEEVWQEFKAIHPLENVTSVLHLTYPEILPLTQQQRQLTEKWQKIFLVREDVLKALEEARNQKIIGKSLEAHVYLVLDPSYQNALASLESDLKQLFIVSGVTFAEHEEMQKFQTGKIKVVAFDGVVCPRCWNHFAASAVNSEGLCHRCEAVVQEYK